MQLLVKDPEIHSKTWMLDISDTATIAEIVGRFLLHRGAGHISQPCLLRMFYDNVTLTDKANMDKTLEQLKVPSRGAVLQTMWSVTAGHISSKCKECRAISELVLEAPTTPRMADGVSSAIPPASQHISADGTLVRTREAQSAAAAAAPVKKGSQPRRTTTQQAAGTTTRKVAEKVATRDAGAASRLLAGDIDDFLPGGTKSTTPVEAMQALERMVAVCLSSTDVVDRLERLASLRRNQELTDAEFSKAKAKLLE